MGPIVAALLAVFLAFLTKLFADEFRAWLPLVTEQMTRAAVRTLPADQRERYREEWRSHLNEIPGEIGKLVATLGFFWAGWKMSGILIGGASQPEEPKSEKPGVAVSLKIDFGTPVPQLASIRAMRELQEQMEQARAQLEETQHELAECKAEFSCPYCAAALTSRGQAPLDSEQDHWDVIQTFACGYSDFAGEIQSPCPADPRFPRFEDFDLRFTELTTDPIWKWSCVAIGKTLMAKRLSLAGGLGRTQDEAAAHVRESYGRFAKSK